METKRQKRIAKLIQQDLAEVLQSDIRKNGIKNLIISVTKIKVTPDLNIAKAYISVFPSDKMKIVLDSITNNAKLIKHEIAQKVRHQLRKMPDLQFFADDTLDYIDKIDEELKSGDNPIKE